MSSIAASGSEVPLSFSGTKVIHEMSDIDIQVQAQEHIYRLTLHKEKAKAGRHALEEVGRSLNAIAQRRRQYFLDYKTCNSVRLVRQWYAWETKRNLETNVAEPRTENAATRGVKMFLHRIDFYGTLLSRFVEYVLQPLEVQFRTTRAVNNDLERVKFQMKQLKKKCEMLLSDNTEILLENVNHTDAEKRFPVISVLPRVHDLLTKMVTRSFQWRLHARFEQQFENIANKRAHTETERDLGEKLKLLRDLDRQIRKTRRSYELIDEEIAARKQAMSSSHFRDMYAECMERIDAVTISYEQCKASIDAHDTTIKTVQQSLGKYKIVGPKRRHKLESSILRRTRKSEELTKIKAELDRLEQHKSRLDEEEVTWLRGGYDNEINLIEKLKEQSNSLSENTKLLEKQREDLKMSYEQSMNEVLKLSNEFEQVSHEYEYVKRLASIVAKTMGNNVDPQLLIKPNKISIDKALREDAYEMTQPKGVAMVIHNEWFTKSPREEKPSKTKDKNNKQLESLFVQLGYYLIHRSNLSAAGMRQHMSGLSDQYHGYHGRHNSLLVAVVAQSNEKGKIITEDGVVSILDFMESFVSSRCPALMGKPKIFLFFLHVTNRDPVLPMVSDVRSSKMKLNDHIFQPEPLSVPEDFVVARIMCEELSMLDGGPTFGGVTASSDDGGLPWFVQSFMKMISNQAGSTDLISILRNAKKQLQDQSSTPRSTATAFSEASVNSLQRKPTGREDHLNIFVDENLKRKLYLMPGI
uniref:uncharacterized protein LOC104265773 n=1 Tax=Ciona intestinalis TaxID=7719 RepID=UPI00089DC762|nr:uncharacterized protein LOC104265773 [Ciona intestinalis]|eukprot:XP_009858817.2 uncharacterized protein LOC104265773 [Ciona intestinalis]